MKNLLVLFSTILVFQSYSQSWDHIRTSGEYYYGVGVGTTDEDAGKMALNELLQQIAVNVSSDFSKTYIGEQNNDGLTFTETVEHVVKTFAQSTLTNVETWTVSHEPKAEVRKYMLRSELQKIYEARIQRLMGMVKIADRAIAKGEVAEALQYYYWAYSLIRSLQYPNRVTDEDGVALVDLLRKTITQILSEVQVNYVDRDGAFVDLSFTYRNMPATIDFVYNDGNGANCTGKAEGGNGSIEMAPGHEDDEVLHLDIEYEYKNFARGDAEMNSVLGVLPHDYLGGKKDVPTGLKKNNAMTNTAPIIVSKPQPNVVANPQPHQNVNYEEACVAPMKRVLEALQSRHYETVKQCFVGRGLDNYNKLVTRRAGRVVGEPKITFYPGPNNTVIARGLQMAFAVVEKGHKTTLVDDVIFTFDQNQKITNLTFGIGTIAENDLLNKNIEYSEETRQQVLSFLENYKTAYCLKDTSFIEAIFDDNATIIVGHVAKRTTRPGYEENDMSETGKEIITYNRYTKGTYIEHLKQVFKRNQFIDIKFTNSDVSWLETVPGKVFSIKLGQEYSSSHYADRGYLFLMVDMTNPDSALIKIRTWQPKPDPDLFGPGHFTK